MTERLCSLEHDPDGEWHEGHTARVVQRLTVAPFHQKIAPLDSHAHAQTGLETESHGAA